MFKIQKISGTIVNLIYSKIHRNNNLSEIY